MRLVFNATTDTGKLLSAEIRSASALRKTKLKTVVMKNMLEKDALGAATIPISLLQVYAHNGCSVAMDKERSMITHVSHADGTTAKNATILQIIAMNVGPERSTSSVTAGDVLIAATHNFNLSKVKMIYIFSIEVFYDKM